MVADEVHAGQSYQSSTEEIRAIIERLRREPKQPNATQAGREQVGLTVEQAAMAGKALDTISQVVTSIKHQNCRSPAQPNSRPRLPKR